jgi:uncharacterized membrane protein YjfL (UPF0719 family)
MDYLVSSFLGALALVPYFLFALALFVAGKFVFDWSTPRIEDDRELTERDNPAFGAVFAGYMLGLGFALSGALSALGPSPIANFINIGVSGLAGILLLRASMVLGELLILPKLRFDSEIVEHRNLGVGFAFMGLFVANGLIIMGVMTGRSDSPIDLFLDIAVYWLTGQVFLVAAWYLFRALALYNAQRAIAVDDNPAAGLSLGGFFVGLGIILLAALRGAGSDRVAELLVALGVGLVGLVLLALARLIAATLLLRKARLGDEVDRQKNLAAGAVSALASIVVALLYAALVGARLG